MKVLVDLELCAGYANCVEHAPRVFDLTDGGVVTLLVDEIPEDLVVGVKEAVRDCPARALAIEA